MDKLKKFLQILCYLFIIVILALICYKLVYEFFIEPKQIEEGISTLFDSILPLLQ